MFNFLLHFDKTRRKVDSPDLYVLIKMIQKLWSGDLFIYKCHVHGGVYLFIKGNKGNRGNRGNKGHKG